MNCRECGKQLPDDANYCLECGLPQRPGDSPPKGRRWETGDISCELLREEGFLNPGVVIRLRLDATGPQGIYVAAQREFKTGLRDYRCSRHGERKPCDVQLDEKDGNAVAAWTDFVAELSREGWDRVLGREEWPWWRFRRLAT